MCEGRLSLGGAERGEPEQSLQMFYSEVQVIAALWFHLILLLLTGSSRRYPGFPLPCSLARGPRSAVHTHSDVKERAVGG